MTENNRMKRFHFFFFLVLFCSATVSSFSQNIGFERDRHISMLHVIKDDIKKNYYDPNFRGINLDERFKAAEEKLKQANAIGQMSAIIAQTLSEFKDSHLFFVPPGKANKTKYGFEMKMYGDKCLVSRVHEKSDAYKKGLRIGDEILAVEKYIPLRENLLLMNYYFRTLRPVPVLSLDVLKSDGKKMNLAVEAKIVPGRLMMDLANSSTDYNTYFREREDAYYKGQKQFVFKKPKEFIVWQIPEFNLDSSKIDAMINQAADFSGLIIDLRGNGGGYVETLKSLLGNLFDKNIKIGDEKSRKETKEILVKTRGKSAFKGNLQVLIDSESGSASEIFAKVIQLEKRGTILGDLSAGAVMESRYFGHEAGIGVVAPYGASVTIADLIMTDGKSLENLGVMPDEKIIMTPQDVANNRDTVLAKAVKNLGFEMSPEEAGSLFLKEKEKLREEY